MKYTNYFTIFVSLHLITIRLYAEGCKSYTPASVGVFSYLKLLSEVFKADGLVGNKELINYLDAHQCT
ncbi:MAG: hypothetical protein K0B37_08030 [Bacteroidales bacterium]|nr:hypothetical protein [Bacteroidales bacterium]